MTRCDRIVACALACVIITPLPVAMATIHPHAVEHPPARVVSLR